VVFIPEAGDDHARVTARVVRGAERAGVGERRCTGLRRTVDSNPHDESSELGCDTEPQRSTAFSSVSLSSDSTVVDPSPNKSERTRTSSWSNALRLMASRRTIVVGTVAQSTPTASTVHTVIAGNLSGSRRPATTPRRRAGEACDEPFCRMKPCAGPPTSRTQLATQS
jgi:hypothetical protein